MTKPDIRDLSFLELQKFLVANGEPPFRAGQIFEWLYKKGVVRFDGMTNLPPTLRAKLTEQFVLATPILKDHRVAADGTQKFLLEFSDHVMVETVLIPTETRATVCLSTQAGCKFHCQFCASGIGGWVRNLTASEILSQVLCARKFSAPQDVTHVVFMGTGEPFDNYDEVLKAIRVINAREGFFVGARRITISTCGIVPGIKRLAEEGMQVELSVSLHGYNDDVRSQLMPVNRKYDLTTLLAACRDYVKQTGRQITFEYVLIDGLTCVPQAPVALGRLLKGLLCKLNLIPYNSVPEHPFKSPTKTAVREFKRQLEQNGLLATVRSSRGEETSAACGQLRHIHQGTDVKRSESYQKKKGI